MKSYRSFLALGILFSLLIAPTTLAKTSTQEEAKKPNVIPDVVYGHKHGMALTLDVLQPSVPGNKAGLLFMMSGGWISKWFPPAFILPQFTEVLSRGFTVFLVRHGSSPIFKVPDAVQDVRQAVKFVGEHASDYGVDPARLGVYGGSAGGHLSLMVGLDYRPGDSKKNRIAAIVAHFPPVDLRQIVGQSKRFPALDFNPELAKTVSPILFVSDDDPPTLLIHGDADTLVPISNSKDIHKLLEDANVVTSFISLAGAGHGFRGAARDEAQKATIAWFEAHLLD